MEATHTLQISDIDDTTPITFVSCYRTIDFTQITLGLVDSGTTLQITENGDTRYMPVALASGMFDRNPHVWSALNAPTHASVFSYENN